VVKRGLRHLSLLLQRLDTFLQTIIEFDEAILYGPVQPPKPVVTVSQLGFK
jgi:hypothetical protein